MLPELAARLGLQAELSRAWTSRASAPAGSAQQGFFTEQTEKGGSEKRRRGKKGRVDAGPAAGRHPLAEHAAWVMAFTQHSQMPRQLIRLVNASRITAPRARLWMEHAPPNKRPSSSLPSREEDVLIEHGWPFANFSYSMPQTRTRGVKVNERTAQTIPGGALAVVFQPAGAANCF